MIGCGMLINFQGLVSELLGEKYNIPKAKDPTSSLARREAALHVHAVQEVTRIGGYEAHRGQSFDRNILPLCRPLVEAIGDRMAFEAAKDKGADGRVLELFEKFAMERQIDWYVGSGLADHSTFQDSVSQACTTVLPVMLQSFDKSSVKRLRLRPDCLLRELERLFLRPSKFLSSRKLSI